MGERHVLVIGADPALLEAMAPMLQRAEFHVHCAGASEMLLDLVRSTPFELVVITYPPKDLPMSALLAAVRTPHSPCRKAGFLVLAEPQLVDEARSFTHLGANRVVGRTWPRGAIWRAFSDLLDVQPRVSIRTVVRLQLSVGPAQALCYTENVSLSGMLVRTGRDLETGVELDFALTLPGSETPVLGAARVTRLADPVRERVQGFGAAFAGFDGDGEERLHAYIARRTDHGRARPKPDTLA